MRSNLGWGLPVGLQLEGIVLVLVLGLELLVVVQLEEDIVLVMVVAFVLPVFGVRGLALMKLGLRELERIRQF